MQVDAGLMGPLKDAGTVAQELEELGYDGLITAETSHDPLFPLLLAAERTQRIDLITSIVVAFARNPMTLAAQAHDLQSFSGGRLILGLGSQIKPHITKRFSMPWSKPAARMREFVQAMKAIWRCWYEDEPLRFEGEFYTHKLMTPMFTPEDTQHGAPKVVVAAVGPLMSEAVAESADGLIAHSFTTRRYMTEVTLPAIERGLAKAGRSRDDFTLLYPGFIVSGASEEAFAESRKVACKRIAFYGSTPAYRKVLEVHGWGELQDELNAMSKRGLWDEMGTLITDEILAEFAVVGEPGEIVPRFRERFDGLVDRTAISLDFAGTEQRPALLSALRA